MDNKKVGGRIRHARRAAGLTQEQLAEKTGVTQTTISAIERGVRTPSLALFVDIVNAVGATANEPLSDVVTTKTFSNAEIAKLSELLKDRSSEESKKIFAVIKALLEP